MKSIKLQLPLTPEAARSLRAGDAVLLSGVLYTARDAAHKRLVECLDAGRSLPIDIQNQLIYYVGPAPAPPGRVVGSAGPTTSYRMDAYAPRLLEAGLLAMMGKGLRSQAVVDAMKRRGAVYFGAVGGAAALYARHIENSEIVAYADLGPEAVHRFTVRNFPALVLIDSSGANLYDIGPVRYKQR
jgi:fumarate hydratase subunit beta